MSIDGSNNSLNLNTIRSSKGVQKDRKRVGRGCGSGFGKTCGRGHKGQKSRAGSGHRIGFEGGQMPIQRRLPKIGFHSAQSEFSVVVRLDELKQVKEDIVNLESLVVAKVISRRAKKVKVILSGEVNQAFKLQGIKVTSGARKLIEAAGGSIED